MKIYFNNFWDNHYKISQMKFWKHFFNKIYFEFCNTIEEADVIINSVFLSENYFRFFKTKKNIYITFEPLYTDLEHYDVNISHKVNPNISIDKNIICPPQMLLSIYNCEIPRSLFLKNRPYRTNIPTKFCCFITRVEKPERIDFFKKLSEYKKVDSLGECLNNTGILAPHDRYEFEKMVSQYKFIITFENCKRDMYITEKILHGFYSLTIPIYWGSDYIHEFYNDKSFINIQDYNIENVNKTIEIIKNIDNNDDLYLKIVNQNVFKDNFDIDDYFEIIKNKFKNNILKTM